MNTNSPSEGQPGPDSAPPLPLSGRLAGIDFGTVRIGIAICDPGQKWASPLETYQVRSPELDAAFFKDLAKRESLVGWVIGLPLHTSGQPSKKSNQAVKFGRWISKATELPVNWIDERFTTAAAREMLSASSMSGNQTLTRRSSCRRSRIDRSPRSFVGRLTGAIRRGF